MPATAAKKRSLTHLGRLARVVASANKALAERGVDASSFMVLIDRTGLARKRSWDVHYIPQDFVQSRGGGWQVVVNPDTGKVQRVLECQ